MKITFILLFIFVHCIGFSQLGSWNNGSFKETDKKSANDLKLWNEGNQINYEEVSRNQNANGEVEVILNDLSGRSMQVRLTDKSSYWKLTNDANWTVLYDGSWSVKPSINIKPVVNNPAPQTNIKEENCQAARNKYLEQNQDVKNANMDPWSHYTNYGKKEGRKWPSCEGSLPTVNISLNPAPVSNPIVNSTNASVSHKPAANIKSVQIGTQTWMVENLNVSTFRNGDSIPQAKNQNEWSKAAERMQPVWCYYDNNPKNGEKYGKLYNWYAVNDPRGLAPAGWHVPGDEEWAKLIDFLGGDSDAEEKLKSQKKISVEISYHDVGGYDETKWVPCSNCSYWTEKQKSNNPCTFCKNTGGERVKTGKYIPKTKEKREVKIYDGWEDGTNESGFSALPGGYAFSHSIGGDADFSGSCYFWSTTIEETYDVWCLKLEHNYDFVQRDKTKKGSGFSVRCVRD